MPLKMFGALPSYFGGKRRLTGELFKHIPNVAQAPVFVDAFLGGGAVSLYAKARGHRVICNDIAMRSFVVGKALIENGRDKVLKPDQARLFAPNPGVTSFVEDHFAPKVFTHRHAKFLDLAFANTRHLEEPKRWLMLLLLIKYALRMRPMGNFGAKTIVGQMDAGDWEAMNQNFVKDAVNRSIPAHPSTSVGAIAREINLGVFSNGLENEVHNLDVFDFLPRVFGDVLYLDPPFAGTLAYETALKPLDDLLRGEVLPADKSKFSGPEAFDFLGRLFEASQHFPLWVMSYGNARIGLDDLVALMRQYRSSVEAREIKYRHIAALSSDEKNQSNREYILVGRA